MHTQTTHPPAHPPTPLLPTPQVLKDAGMSKEEVDQVVLVGGSTRIPKVGGWVGD